MNRNAGDYTLARRKMFDDMSAEDLDREIREFENVAIIGCGSLFTNQGPVNDVQSAVVTG